MKGRGAVAVGARPLSEHREDMSHSDRERAEGFRCVGKFTLLFENQVRSSICYRVTHRGKAYPQSGRPAGMNLVEATREDVDLLADYWYRLASEMEPYSELNELALDGPGDAVEGIEEHFLDDEDRTPFLLEAEGETVGFLLLHDGDHPSRTLDSYVEIVDLFVAEDHRNEGHGTAAIEAVREIAREGGADYLTVACEWDNDGARRLYERTGFAEKQVSYAQRL